MYLLKCLVIKLSLCGLARGGFSTFAEPVLEAPAHQLQVPAATGSGGLPPLTLLGPVIYKAQKSSALVLPFLLECQYKVFIETCSNTSFLDNLN